MNSEEINSSTMVVTRSRSKPSPAQPAILPFVERSAPRPSQSGNFLPAVPSPLLQTPTAAPAATGRPERRRTTPSPPTKRQKVAKAPSPPPITRQIVLKPNKKRRVVAKVKGGIKEKIWCLDCQLQIESKPSNSLVRAHIRQHEARGERTLYARATPAGLYRVGPEFWTNDGQML